MKELTGADGPYDQRCLALVDYGIALWDVLAESVRPGSLDTNIRTDTAEANDFAGFFAEQNKIGLICFNGRKAAQMFQRFVVLEDGAVPTRRATLPSTSPAYASMSYAEKLATWRNTIVL